jgi:hypothetical protein
MRGIIIDILEDSDNGSERDTYTVRVNEPFSLYNGDNFTIHNEDVVEEQPQEVRRTTGQMTYIRPENAFIWGTAGETSTAIPIPEDENEEDSENIFDEGLSDDDDAEEQAEEIPQQQRGDELESIIAGNVSDEEFRQRLEQSIRVSVWNTTRPTTTDPQPLRRSARSIPVPPLPNPSTPTSNIVYNEVESATADEIARYTIQGVRPAGMLNIDGNRRPVYDAAELQPTGSIGGRDYNMTAESVRFLIVTINGTQISPAYDARHGVIVNKTRSGGIWVNEYADSRILNTDYYRDNLRVKWASRDSLWRYLERNGIPIPALYPKKKLRRKYKEMPKIKEEKYYGNSKEFIA